MPTPVTRAVPEVGTDPLEIKHAAAHYGVVRLRERMDGPGPFVALLEKLGPLMFTHGETPVDGFEQLNIVSNKGRKTPPKSVFHSDTSYVARPPSYGGLLGIAVPSKGGATLFTDQYA